MIIQLINNVHAGCIVLFLLLVPGIALSQERKEPATPVSTAEPAAVQTATRPEGVAPYIIKKGDTLWDLSNTFMKDPFLWPFIWKANPTVTNPDLIYPGKSLTIPDLAPIERALQTPAVQEQQEEQVEKQAVAEKPAGAAMPVEKAAAATNQIQRQTAENEVAVPKSTLILPEEKPIPVVDKNAMLSAGFVDVDQNSDVIVGFPQKGKTVLGRDELVFVKIRDQENVKIGDQFLIYSRLNDVKHPKTKKTYGKLIRGLGVLQITAKDAPNIMTARIILSFDAIEKGNLLTPYQEPTLVYPSSEKKSKDISGFILEITDGRTVIGQTDYVYLDKGRADGVEAGDKFSVYAERDDPSFPRRMIGEVQVFLVKEHTSTAVVQKSLDYITKGNMIDFKK